jgi:hypothetical protein
VAQVLLVLVEVVLLQRCQAVHLHLALLVLVLVLMQVLKKPPMLVLDRRVLLPSQYHHMHLCHPPPRPS